MRSTLIALGLIGALGLTATFTGGVGLSDPPKDAAKTEEAKKDEAKKEAKPTLLDALKPLAGTWETEHDGKTVVALVGKITSAGSVYQETMFPGTDHEMTNMYHMDGDALVVTHYCAIGNQPRMKCAAAKGNVYEFTFDSGTNINSPADLRMGKLVLTITDIDHIVQEWTSYKDGKPAEGHAVKIDCTRQKK